MTGPFRHIVIEGPIGVGKTSLARKLGQHLGAEPMLEKPQDNPFLERFYRDGARYALQTQLFFLFQRLEQYRGLSQVDLFSATVVSDFLFAKDAIFAKLILSDEEYRLYAMIYRQLSPQIPEPDLVIWLQAEPATLLARVRQRAIPMEQGISETYLRRLCDAYVEYFHGYDEAPVFAINTAQFHPAQRDADFAVLLEKLHDFRGRRVFFNPQMAQTADSP